MEERDAQLCAVSYRFKTEKQIILEIKSIRDKNRRKNYYNQSSKCEIRERANIKSGISRLIAAARVISERKLTRHTSRSQVKERPNLSEVLKNTILTT